MCGGIVVVMVLCDRGIVVLVFGDFDILFGFFCGVSFELFV